MWKGGSKTTSIRHDIIDNSKEPTKTTIRTNKSSGRLKGIRLTCKKLLYFYTFYNEQSENKIKKRISFTTVSKTIKYLGTNLIKGV